MIALTKIERLKIFQRRYSLTKVDCAQRYSTTKTEYTAWILGRRDIPDDIKVPEIRDLCDAEKAVVFRWRSGLGIKEVSEAMKCSWWHANKMELGFSSAQPLLAFWKERGYE